MPRAVEHPVETHRRVPIEEGRGQKAEGRSQSLKKAEGRSDIATESAIKPLLIVQTMLKLLISLVFTFCLLLYNPFILQTFGFKLMSYKNQFIWKRAVQLAINCYQITKHFPQSELYGLTSQIRRSAVSVASNIAEGYGRQSKNEYIQFLHIALGSLRELDTQLIIAKEVSLADENLFSPVMTEVEEMQSIMVSTLNKLKQPKQ